MTVPKGSQLSHKVFHIPSMSLLLLYSSRPGGNPASVFFSPNHGPLVCDILHVELHT